MISIVIPLYNKESEIINTLKSIFNQTYQNYEIIIVNDGSTDNSVAKIREFTDDNRLRIINKKNGGVGSARNEGISNAKYEYISFIDADDEWMPDYLATQVDLIEKFPQCAVFSTGYKLRNRDNKESLAKIAYNVIKFNKDKGLFKNYFVLASRSNPPLWTSSIVVRKDAINSIGGFKENVKSGEDLLAWAHLACRYGIAHNKNVLAIYRTGYSNPRPPERIDIVGKELESLLSNNRRIPSLKTYISLWYKMRMSRCLVHRMYGRALLAFVKSLRYNPFQIGVYNAMLKFGILGLRHKI